MEQIHILACLHANTYEELRMKSYAWRITHDMNNLRLWYQLLIQIDQMLFGSTFVVPILYTLVGMRQTTGNINTHQRILIITPYDASSSNHTKVGRHTYQHLVLWGWIHLTFGKLSGKSSGKSSGSVGVLLDAKEVHVIRQWYQPQHGTSDKKHEWRTTYEEWGRFVSLDFWKVNDAC
jgi:hypothetical protein